MAVVNGKGVNYTDYSAVPQKMVGVDQWGGRLRVMYDTYTETAAGDAGSTFKMGRLPKGARIMMARFKASKTFGSTCTLAIAAGSVTLRAAATSTVTTWQELIGVGSQVDTASDVVVTTAAAATPGDATIEVEIFYTVD